jgi:hypothetical protein
LIQKQEDSCTNYFIFFKYWMYNSYSNFCFKFSLD